MYRIVYYRTPRRDSPFEMFLQGHNDNVRAKFIRILDVLANQGPNLPRPYAGFLRDGIRELRVSLAGNAYRALYFFFVRSDIVITHVFMKKTHRVPNEEVERALRYKRDYEERFGRGGAAP